jgi:cbb3-type cytochrome oxidase subunit 3
MRELADIARALLGPEPGITLLLFFMCGLLVWVYWREKKKNEDIQEERLQEAREDTKEMTEALVNATKAQEGFKKTLDAIMPHIHRR